MENKAIKRTFRRTAHSDAEKSSSTVCLCGLGIFGGTREESEDRLNRFLEGTKSAPALVFTPNLEMLAAAKSDPRVRALLREADLLLPDGIGVLLLSGFRIKERLPGIEAGEFLLSLAGKHGCRVYLLGGKKGIAEAAANALKKRFPSICIVGTHHGYFAPQSKEEATVTEELRAAAPDLLIVCMGFPRQEEFLMLARRTLPSLRLGIGLGGALDVWSGNTKRAPGAFQRLGLEWLWRVTKEPKRLPRLLKSLRDLIKKEAVS